jgi:hypothetical protein
MFRFAVAILVIFKRYNVDRQVVGVEAKGACTFAQAVRELFFTSAHVGQVYFFLRGTARFFQ